MLDCSLQLHGFLWLCQIEFMLPGLAQRPFVISSKDSSSIAHQNNLQLWQEQFIKDPLKRLHFGHFTPVISLPVVCSLGLCLLSAQQDPPVLQELQALSCCHHLPLQLVTTWPFPTESNNILIS